MLPVPVNCPNCGGNIPTPGDSQFVQCPYCRSAVKIRETAPPFSQPAVPSASPPQTEAAPPAEARSEIPWYRSTAFLMITFIFFLPLWVALILSDPRQPKFIKGVAWVLTGIMAYAVIRGAVG